MTLDYPSWAHTARQAGPAIVTSEQLQTVTASPANNTQAFFVWWSHGTVTLDYPNWAYTASLAETPTLPAKE